MSPGLPAGRQRASTVWLCCALAASIIGGGFIAWQSRTPTRLSLPPLTLNVEKPLSFRTELSKAHARALAPDASWDAIAGLGRLYEGNGYVSEAKACWLILHRLQPREAHWTYYLANDAEYTSDNDGETYWLGITTRLAPDYAPAWLALGQLSFDRGQFDEAARAFRHVLAKMPSDPYALLGLARVSLSQGKHEEGRRELELLIEANPTFSSARNLLAEIFEKDGDSDSALQQRWQGTVAGRFRAPEDPWKNELRPFCYDAEQFIVWGETDSSTKHGDLGRSALERAVALAPNSLRTCEMLARFYLDQNEPAKASALLGKRADLVRGSESLMALLSETYMALDQTDMALATADRGLSQFPDSANLYNARGLALASASRFDEAIAAYRAAIERAPSTSSASANLGLVLLLLGKKAEARAQLQQALRLQPGYSKAIIALASLELESGNLSSAFPYIIFYYEQSPGSQPARDLVTRYYLALARAAMQDGKPDEAEKAYREGLARVADSAKLYGLLGLHYTRTGRFPEAVASLEKAHRLQPDDPRVNRLLVQLYLQAGRKADARALAEEDTKANRAHKDVPAVTR